MVYLANSNRIVSYSRGLVEKGNKKRTVQAARFLFCIQVWIIFLK